MTTRIQRPRTTVGRSHRRQLIAAVVSLGTAVTLHDVAPAQAACGFCDEVVILDTQMKQCLLNNFDTYLGAIDKTGKGYALIDLASCQDTVQMAENERQGLGALPDLPRGTASGRKRLKANYLFDAASLSCLRDLVSKSSDPFDPSARFDLFTACEK